MKIILEGVDGAGKTTLAKILAEKYKLDICHCTQHDAKDFEFYSQTLRKENIIWDRHTLGELIYPSIFDREPELTEGELGRIISLAIRYDVKMLVLTTDDSTIKSRLLSRGTEDYRIIKNCEKINQMFLHYANVFHIPVIDTTKITLNDIFNLIEKENEHGKTNL